MALSTSTAVWSAAAGLPAAPPRTLFLLAHPDDETLGASALLAALGPAAYLLHVTDGAPHAMSDARHAGCATRESYAALRRHELAIALGVVGIGAAQCDMLGVVDQEAWRDLAGLARAVQARIEALRPALVVTHPYEGGHPDHDATAFAAHAACARLAADGAPVPALVEQTSYHADPATPDQLATGTFLDVPGAAPAVTVALTAAERARKAAMYAAHASQARVITQFPIGEERFRRAPSYDFTRPPAAAIWYERLGWGITAADLCAAVRDARAALGS
ncbi:MAG TPA: PIG-L family deacetylase [Gemmatirosa sp.]